MYVKENVYNCQNLNKFKKNFFKIILNYNYFNNHYTFLGKTTFTIIHD